MFKYTQKRFKKHLINNIQNLYDFCHYKKIRIFLLKENYCMFINTAILSGNLNIPNFNYLYNGGPSVVDIRINIKVTFEEI